MDISKYRGVGGRGSRNMRGGRGMNPKSNPNPKQNISYEIVNNTLSPLQIQYFLSIFPTNIAKLSYETVAPKKVSSPEYDLCLAIPFGKKAYIWYTYYYTTPISLLFELNRENQINNNISILSYGKDTVPVDFDLGTIVSGTIYENPDVPLERTFILDDIHIYKGIVISNFVFREKTGFIYDFFRNISVIPFSLMIRLPILWNNLQE